MSLLYLFLKIQSDVPDAEAVGDSAAMSIDSEPNWEELFAMTEEARVESEAKVVALEEERRVLKQRVADLVMNLQEYETLAETLRSDYEELKEKHGLM